MLGSPERTRLFRRDGEFLGAAVSRLDAVFGDSPQLPETTRRSAVSSDYETEELEADLDSGVTTASPEFMRGVDTVLQVIDSIGSVNGDRTRTLRLERAL